MTAEQFRELYHGTNETSAAVIREPGLRPSKGRIAIPSAAGTLTGTHAEAERYANRTASPTVLQFHVPESQAGHYLHKGMPNPDETATNYALRRTLPARFLAPEPQARE
jgi:hypothetical protein